jgi:hypothetical protein
MIMNMLRKFALLPAVIFAFSIVSCKKESLLLPDLEGSLVGYVFTCDEFAKQIDDQNGILVSAYGRSGIARTHTDNDGRFEFKHLQAGTYELILEKAGYGTLKRSGVQHLGGKPTIIGLYFDGSTWNGLYLFQIPGTKIMDLAVDHDTLRGNFVFTGDLPEYLSLMIYLSDEQDFVNSEARTIITRCAVNNNGQYFFRMLCTELPFQPGDTLYYRAAVYIATDYFCDYNDLVIIDTDTYFNYTLNRIVYPVLGDESETFSFVYPE